MTIYLRTQKVHRRRTQNENRVYRLRKYGFCHDWRDFEKGIFQKEEIIVSNLTEEGARRSREKLGVAATLDNREVVRSTRLLVLAVKPQFYEEVLEEVKDLLTTEHMVVGIAPGKTLAWLEKNAGSH